MGKNKVVAYHRQVPYRVLERIHEESVLDSRGSDCSNMVIHGDNLEALKALLPEYEGKVDCIYIDPPYNTGNVDELKDVDLMSEECPIRFIITVEALSEGWDCPFAYVLATVAKSSTNFAVICIFFCTMSSMSSFLMAAMASMVGCLLLLTVLPLARSCSTISSVRGVR